MKREKLTYPIIKPIKPFIWKECRFCKREFKREFGYKILDYTMINSTLYYSFCCNECAKNMEEVEVLINRSKLNLNILRKKIADKNK